MSLLGDPSCKKRDSFMPWREAGAALGNRVGRLIVVAFFIDSPETTGGESCADTEAMPVGRTSRCSLSEVEGGSHGCPSCLFVSQITECELTEVPAR